MPKAPLLALIAALALSAQPQAICPLRDVKPGLKATGRTVFNGTTIEEFHAEILGVLENAGPNQSIILARLSGGPLAQTGVLQGMSGSPVYDPQGRLIGAVALSFPFSKEPIAGIRPIQEMLDSTPQARAAAPPANPLHYTALLPARPEIPAGPTRMAEISTPLSFNGFTRSTLDHFAPALRAAGLEPVQGVSGGGRPTQPSPNPTPILPGSMISVQLVSGDLSVGADGTVTHVDGNRLYAFGHRFLAVGPTAMPFARAEVLALLPSLNSSFKISNARQWAGAITSDANTAISGEIGRQVPLLPVTIQLRTPARTWSYSINVVQDRLFTPLLLQMAVFSAIEATERTVGLGSISLNARLTLDGAPPIALSNIYSAEIGAPQQVSAAVAAPIAAVLTSGFDSLKIRGLSLTLDVSNDKRQFQLDSVYASRRTVRPGESIDITAIFTGESGAELTRTATYQVPSGAPSGPLFFTVTDGPSANLAEFRQFLTAPPRSPSQLTDFISGLFPNDRAYVRVWRSTATLQVQGENLPAPPASMAPLLARTASSQPNSLVAKLAMAPAAALISGSRTIQVEVKE